MVYVTYYAAPAQMFKHLNRFCRDHKDGLVEVFTKANLRGALAILKKMSMKKFANWRWGTLYDCCKDIANVIDVLQSNHAIIFYM